MVIISGNANKNRNMNARKSRELGFLAEGFGGKYVHGGEIVFPTYGIKATRGDEENGYTKFVFYGDANVDPSHIELIEFLTGQKFPK